MVLALDSSSGTALQNAIAAAEAGGAPFLSAAQVGNGPIGLTIPAAVAPAVDGTPKAVYLVTFAAVPNGATPQPLLVLAWPQTNGSVTTPAASLAAAAAASSAGAGVSQVVLMGTVGIDATTLAASTPADLTRFAFLSLFTLAELTAVLSSTDPIVKTIIFRFENAEDIYLGDPATIQGVEYLASVALITAARAAQVLAATPYLTVTAPAIAATQGRALSPVSAVAAGGSGEGYIFAGANLPPGMSMSPAGQITGEPTVAGTCLYSVSLTDSVGDTATATGTITVS